MSTTIQIIIAILTIITTIVGIIISIYKKGLKTDDNADKLKEISEQLGLNQEQTLYKCIKEKFNSISNDIGRNSNSSLTEQHNDIKESIENIFSVIQKRYNDEDAEYRKFMQSQYDFKNTIDNFSKDYYEHIKTENLLIDKCFLLEQEISQSKAENEQLKSQLNHNQYSNDDMEL